MSSTRWLGLQGRCGLSGHDTESARWPAARGKQRRRGFASQKLGWKWANRVDCIMPPAWKGKGKEKKKDSGPAGDSA
jgi:hypothetical protein